MAITTEDVKKLRDQTGVSIMQCKQALEEASGDMEQALMLLRKKGSAIAAKKSDRELGAGVAATYLHGNKEIAVSVILQCETDFVSKNEDFSALAYDIAMQIAATNPLYTKREDLPEDEMEKIKAMFADDVAGKPENLHEQILSGKIDSYLKGVVLLEQDFIKDTDRTVKDLISDATQKFGERIEIGQFSRLSVK
ncbi:elongation factor Ts [Candidatus Kaiserbacteria bacterium CG10_big_fil_rev_8_21_14_0_10_45_20]|uniref:Elongation factor Ts n=1 Tax=Candidatus Kaiserbacteria bacterium CG10_big_fil_rev_8_21_14_0_10_45_20 TaxID=1974607 RepID=A0A2H0UEY7_9BACT|nr:MAG: elongation factor Ts [Candidatus Kaiserbacteria bacterium CG10_big_fil_rev_8_21_14_0_10_45_20]